MTNSNVQNQGGNTNAIIFVVDGQPLLIAPTQLCLVDVQSQLMARCRLASNITIRGWDQVLNISPEAQDFVFSLMRGTMATLRFYNAGLPEEHLDPFAATLQLSLNGEDLPSIARATALVIGHKYSLVFLVCLANGLPE